MGYHITEIKKGTLGETSKIVEEFEEFLDGIKQENKLLQLCELVDLLGAIEAYVAKYNLTLSDLIAMMERTKQAFKDGDRS